MASRGAIAARQADVRDRLNAAMERLSVSAGVPLPASVPVAIRQPDLKAAFELERVAAFMEDLATWAAPSVDSDRSKPRAGKSSSSH